MLHAMQKVGYRESGMEVIFEETLSGIPLVNLYGIPMYAVYAHTSLLHSSVEHCGFIKSFLFRDIFFPFSRKVLLIIIIFTFDAVQIMSLQQRDKHKDE